MDFNAYVQGCKENSPEGDFAQDWDQDRNKPTVTTWEDLDNYLTAKRACPEAIESAKCLFSKWSGVSYDLLNEDV
jgi:hypothetical protein